MHSNLSSHLVFVGLVLTLVNGCAGSGPNGRGEDGRVEQSRSTVALDSSSYPVFPNADVGADPSVSADLGGKGFSGKGWHTNTDFGLTGDPRAVKGGIFRYTLTDFPTTLRPAGPHTAPFDRIVSRLVYETLLTFDSVTLEYVPALATHWRISDDGGTYRFRLDPNARWSDGSPVTSEDVVASWGFWMDRALLDPVLPSFLGTFERPVAESKYLVRVKAGGAGWRSFMDFSTRMLILPAHALKGIDGGSYIRDYNYKMVTGSGPYRIAAEDIEQGKVIRIRRRSEYWASNYRRNIGIDNFDEIQVIVVRDRNVEFEMFKKGTLDAYNVLRARMWAEDLDFREVHTGLIQKRRIWNHKPIGFGGIALNTRQPPLGDVRIRKALRHLFNRELMIDKLMYGAYTPMDSYWPGSIYENTTNEKVRYDPDTATRLLNDAGFNGYDKQGRLTRNGVPLSLDLLYIDRIQEPFFTIFQEDLSKVGITLTLHLVTPESLIALVAERKFTMAALPIAADNYAASAFPDPEASLLSSLADLPGSGNITGFKSATVDQLIAKYKTMDDSQARIAILHEIDHIYTNDHHWLMLYYAPYERIAFWNKFGSPKGYLGRTGDYSDILEMWWTDPERSKMLQQAQRSNSGHLDVGETEDKYWLLPTTENAALQPPKRQ